LYHTVCILQLLNAICYELKLVLDNVAECIVCCLMTIQPLDFKSIKSYLFFYLIPATHIILIYIVNNNNNTSNNHYLTIKYTAFLDLEGFRSWIYNYLCKQCLSPLKLWVRISIRRSVLDTKLCDKVCQWLGTGFLHQ
jgi:hypothetical protein